MIRSYVTLHGSHGGELDQEEIIGGAVQAAICTLANRSTFADGDVIRIDMIEVERD
jgi:hypothetical protein